MRNTSRFSTQTAFIIAAILVAFVIASPSQFSDGGKSVKSNYAAGSNKKRTPVKRSKIRLDDPEEKPHFLVGSYYTTKNGFTSTILLNNKGPRPIEVEPTLYSLSGQILQVPPLTVPANSHQTIDLSEWATIGGGTFKEGNVHLFHRGEDIVLGAQIQIVKESNSLLFEKKLDEIGTYDSRQLESVWWHPSDGVKSNVVLTNTGNNYITVSARLTRKPAISNTPQDFTLLPNETKVLNIKTDFNQGDQYITKKVLGVSLTHDGEEGDLLAWGIIKDAALGYSYSADFTNPNSLKSKELHGAGLQLVQIGTDKLKPIVVLRNNSTQAIEVDIKVPYTKENGNKKKVALDTIALLPGELHNVDMRPVKGLKKVRVAGIELKHTGPKGSLTASVQSVSESKTNVFRTLLWNPKSTRSSASIYPWSLSGSSHTKAYIKNSGFKSERFHAYLTWENGGEYTLSTGSLEKDETVEFDVKALRDSQVADEHGRIIPQGVNSGQIHWYIRRTETSKEESAQNKSPLVGQMLQVDSEKGINFSYSCLNCCDYGVSFIEVVSNEPDLNAGETVQFTAFKHESDCYRNYPKNPPNITASSTTNWNSSDTSIATVNNGSNKGLVQGVNGGSVSIQATGPVADHYVNPSCEDGGGPLLRFDKPFKFSNASYLTNSRTLSPLLPGDCDCICFNTTGYGSSPIIVFPTVTLGEIKHIEKNGISSVQVRVDNLSISESVELRTRTVSGGGSAAFSDGGSGTTTSIMVPGGTNQSYLVKGLVTSSSNDNVALEARFNSTVVKSELFSVAEITSLNFERIHTTPNGSNGNEADIPLDNNPGTDGTHTAGEGLRIYPGRTSPSNATDRATLRVKATIAPANLSKAYVYLSSFDLDDPSANTGPLDPGDSTNSPSNDNRGAVTISGVGTSKSGIFANPSSGKCESRTTASNVSKIQCQVAGTTSVTNYKVPMNPGDNVAVVASLQETYRDQIGISQSAPVELVNQANQILPVSGASNSSNVQGIRTKMLTVWRKLHVETDRMTNVTNNNRATGSFSRTVTIPGGNALVAVPINNNPALGALGRFYGGRLSFGNHSLVPLGHSATAINVRNPGQPINVTAGTSFTIYDDDDYNSNDPVLDGDSGEAINPIANVLSGSYDSPFLDAYLTLDFNWNPQYDQANVPFDLNVTPQTLPALVTNNRDSAGDERNDFWIAYLVLGYQYAVNQDYDGFTSCNASGQCTTEAPFFGGTFNQFSNCDCLNNSSTCPSTGSICSAVPVGGVGSILFQEVIRDHKNTFQTIFGRTITLDETITAHELGHQFGLGGDNLNSSVFQLMDYPNYNGGVNGPSPSFHPQHINIIRSRLKSPGQQ